MRRELVSCADFKDILIPSSEVIETVTPPSIRSDTLRQENFISNEIVIYTFFFLR